MKSATVMDMAAAHSTGWKIHCYCSDPTCFFPEPPNRLIPEEEDVEESELRLACLSQMDNCVLTALKWSSTSLSRAWLWEQRVWRKERAARTRSSS